MTSQHLFTPSRLSAALRSLVWGGLAAGTLLGQAHAFESGSTGADGALSPTVNTEILLPPSGVLNYTSVNIPSGVTVTFRRNTLNTPVVMLVSGDATIAGTINISGTRGADTGTTGNGNLADDGTPGRGGPGGFDGGRGGRPSTTATDPITAGGAGLGPGAGRGAVDGFTGGNACSTVENPLASSYRNIGGEAGHVEQITANSLSNCLKPSPNGGSYGSAMLQPLVGGSGGGGGGGGTAFAGEGGGGGGGAIMIAVSGTMNLTGIINARGGHSAYQSGTGVGGRGGAGSGGAIRLVATTLAGSGQLYAMGGCTMNASSGQEDRCISTYGWTSPANRASAGRIRLEAENLTFNPLGNSVIPTASVGQPGPVFLANVPTLRISRVGGQDVPANPTGRADLSFPADLANPVTVEFVTTNVPAGNTVRLTVAPSQGQLVEAISPAIVANGASGTASVQVSLPQGPSTLQATTTYTVVVAMGDALSHFAQNERVEKVELIATLGGEPQARLITVSGKSYLVPAAVLQTVGLAG